MTWSRCQLHILIEWVDKLKDVQGTMGHFIFRLNLSFKPNRNLNA